MVQEGTEASQGPKNTSETTQRGPSAIKKKVVRRDPDKRRMQNRLAQQTYREKQRKRIQELERRAAEQGNDTQGNNEVSRVSGINPTADLNSGFIGGSLTDAETINPSHLHTDPETSISHTSTETGIWGASLIFEDFNQWIAENPIYDEYTAPVLFFNCGCPTLHIPNHSKEVLLPVIPDPYKNNLQIDIICIISAMLENCLSLGITRSMYCSDDATSLFYRAHADSDPMPEAIVTSVQRGSRALHFDLRPTRKQIVVKHHPFIDVIPFKDIRDNIIDNMNEMEEDEFFHDALNHLTCWGGIAGAHTGTPWDSRSWEATEEFILKWSHIVGGEEGELARNSKWWRSLRGERTVIEIS
ncbi:hypothetical protein F53441_2929 [Fusarium austroafricanum]|uniref:BZIP domain-containing protein n=1 Tax=Fusarium austroafricanum TaxID=2364996 RepID=A0A8H4KR71_9HYPO|nr:hypothetical protein F53441_2929 [Fusarium austroafricanum]